MAKILAQFDNEQTLIATRRYTVEEHDLKRGDTVPASVSADRRVKLWLMNYADYERDFRPTPEQGQPSSGAADSGGAAASDTDAEDTAWLAESDGVRVDGPKGGWFTITDVATGEEAKEQGADAAKAKAEELRAANRNADTTATGDAATDTGEADDEAE